MVRIEIDGVEVEAEAGSMIIQVADQLEIPIPRFCYHRKLSVAANCRMCLVQVEKAPKPLPACATPIADGMKIWTKTPAAIDAQKSVMEFLLINHPLDCPICDQGGECELQDTSMSYGQDFSRFNEEKRVVLDKNLGSLIATDMTRCIQCTRCVRFGTEIAGERELGATGRGETVNITTFIEQNINSEVSGNIIDLCPVGALTSKPFRFRARAWELTQYANISPHDCIGSNLYLHVLNNKVMRVVPRSAEHLNEIWLSDRDRFSYQALQHDERLRKPMLRKQNNLAIVSWLEALKYAVAGLKLSIDTYGADQLAVLASPSVTVEEYFVLQQLTRSLGGKNIDHRLRQLDFTSQVQAPLFPNLGLQFNELEQQDLVLLIGSQLHKEQPVAGLKLRKMVVHGGKVCVLNPVEFKFNFAVAAQSIVSPADLLNELAGVAKAVLVLTKNANIPAALSNIKSSEQQILIAQQILSGKKVAVLLGQLAIMHPEATALIALGNLIAQVTNGKIGVLSDGANAAGAWLAGCVPHRLAGGATTFAIGKNALEMLSKPLKCYILYALEPEFDSLLGEQALSTLKQADFVIVFSSYQSQALLDIADVILPITTFAESTGTMVNLNGEWQTTTAVVEPFADSRAGWKVLTVLGNLAGLEDFEYSSSTQILDKLKALLLEISKQTTDYSQINLPDTLNITAPKKLSRIAPVPLYAADSLVRRATALQATSDAVANPTVQMHNNTAKQFGIIDGALVTVKTSTGQVLLPAEINNRIAEFSVLIYQANKHTNCLGAIDSDVELIV